MKKQTTHTSFIPKKYYLLSYERNLFFHHFWKISFILFAFIPFQLSAQYSKYEKAQQLAFSAQHKEAETLLNQLNQDFPEFLTGQLLRAYNHAWWKKYDIAIAEFYEILEKDSKNIEALNGLGYTLSWAGDTPKAVNTFTEVLKLDENNTNARKGLGYTYLIAQNTEAASAVFNKLIKDFPSEVEYHVGLGQAYLIEGETKKARQNFEYALNLDQNSELAKTFLNHTRTKASVLEADIWAGWTKAGDQARFGLRLLQLSYQFDKRFTSYLRYDNSLSLDNIDFIARKEGASSIMLGTLAGWNTKLASRLEYGLRFFPDTETQHLVKGEQVFYFPKSFNIRVGGFAGLSSKTPAEWFAFISTNLPIGKIFAFEPTYFYAKDENSSDPQHRFILSGKLHLPSGFELTAGGFYGRSNLDYEDSKREIKGGYAVAMLPVHKNIWAMLSANYEDGFFNKTTVIAGGLKWRIHK